MRSINHRLHLALCFTILLAALFGCKPSAQEVPIDSAQHKYVELPLHVDLNSPTVGMGDFILITNNPGSDSSDAKSIIKEKLLLPLAMQKHDAALFDSVLSKNFLYQDEDALFNREEYIHDRVNAKWNIYDVQYENMVLKFFGELGILTYRNKVKEIDEFGKDQLYLYYWTDIWIKKDGRWKLMDLRALN